MSLRQFAHPEGVICALTSATPGRLYQTCPKISASDLVIAVQLQTHRHLRESLPL
jgi:hypothetical protein